MADTKARAVQRVLRAPEGDEPLETEIEGVDEDVPPLRRPVRLEVAIAEVLSRLVGDLDAAGLVSAGLGDELQSYLRRVQRRRV